MEMHQVFDTVIVPLIQKYPKVSSVVLFMGAAKIFVHPIQTFLVSIITLTPTKKDDEAMNRLLSSKAWKVLAYIFNYVTEIKLPGAPGTVKIEVKAKPSEADKSEAKDASPSAQG